MRLALDEDSRVQDEDFSAFTDPAGKGDGSGSGDTSKSSVCNGDTHAMESEPSGMKRTDSRKRPERKSKMTNKREGGGRGPLNIESRG